MENFLDMLDRWVEKDRAAADAIRLGGARGRESRRRSRIPRSRSRKCPVRSACSSLINSTAGSTSLRRSPAGGSSRSTATTSSSTNRNGVWDYRGTPTQAWQRLGLLKKGEELTRPRMSPASERNRAVGRTASSPKTRPPCVDDARKADLQPRPTRPARRPAPLLSRVVGAISRPPRLPRLRVSGGRRSIPVCRLVEEGHPMNRALRTCLECVVLFHPTVLARRARPAAFPWSSTNPRA